MKSLELMKIHPKAAIVVKQWMLEKLLDSLNDDTLPENFKDFVRENGIDDDKIYQKSPIFLNSTQAPLSNSISSNSSSTRLSPLTLTLVNAFITTWSVVFEFKIK